MQSKKLPSLEKLKRNLKKILKKYDVHDIIIFGSYIKSKEIPKDIDLALIVKEKDISLISKIKEELKLKVHIELIPTSRIYYNKLFMSLISEGYSVREDAFLRQLFGITPMKLYSYNLKHLNKSQKTQHSFSLRKMLKKINGKKIGAGAVLIPIEQTGYFEEFLDAWQLKYKTKEWTVF